MAGNPITAAYLFNNPSLHGFITAWPSTSVSTGRIPEQAVEQQKKALPRSESRQDFSWVKNNLTGLAQKAARDAVKPIKGTAICCTELFASFFAFKRAGDVARDGLNTPVHRQRRRRPSLSVFHSIVP